MAHSKIQGHTVRPPKVSTDYPNQRYFHGADGDLNVTSRNEAWDTFAEVRVYRDGEQDVAQLRMRIAALGLKANVEVDARFNPEQLREIAQRLLDAAADIERHPAAMLKVAA